MANKKATQAEKERRVTQVVEMICAGASRKQIMQLATSPEDDATLPGWGIKPRQVDHYIAEARARIREEARYNRREIIGLAIRRHEDLYQKAYRGQDWATCLKILRSLNELLGLNQHFTVGDLEKLVKLEQLLTGLPTERTEHEQAPARDEVYESPMAVIERLAGLN